MGEKKSSISIVSSNLTIEQLLFVQAVIIPVITEALNEEGVSFGGFYGFIPKTSKRLCNGKCKNCIFEQICNESEEEK